MRSCEQSDWLVLGPTNISCSPPRSWMINTLYLQLCSTPLLSSSLPWSTLPLSMSRLFLSGSKTFLTLLSNIRERHYRNTFSFFFFLLPSEFSSQPWSPPILGASPLRLVCNPGATFLSSLTLHPNWPHEAPMNSLNCITFAANTQCLSSTFATSGGPWTMCTMWARAFVGADGTSDSIYSLSSYSKMVPSPSMDADIREQP
jgi:hypothetical protein